MAGYAIQSLGGWRNEACAISITVPGMDLTSVAVRAQVRLAGDTPGSPLLTLASGVAAGATGILVLPTTTDGFGSPVSHLVFQVAKADMQGLPYSGEQGDAWVGAYALQIAGVTRMTGAFAVLASPIDSDNAPANRPMGWGAAAGGALADGVTLTIGDSGVTLHVYGLIEVQQAVALAQSAAASALAARASISGLLSRPNLTIGRTSTPVTGTTYSDFTTAFLRPVTSACHLRRVSLFAGAGMTVIALKLFRMVSGTWTQIGSNVSLTTTPSAVNTFDSANGDFAAIAFQPGDIVGWHSTGGSITFAGAPNDTYLFSGAGGDQATLAAAVQNSARLQIGFGFDDDAAALVRSDVEKLAVAFGSPVTQVLGKSAVASGGVATNTFTLFFAAVAVASGVVRQMRAFMLGAQTVTLNTFVLVNGVLVATGTAVSVSLAPGSNLVPVGLPIRAGEMIGFYGGANLSGIVGATANPFYYANGDVTGGMSAVPTGPLSGSDLQVGFDIDYTAPVPKVIALTQGQYNALAIKDPNTLYGITA